MKHYSTAILASPLAVAVLLLGVFSVLASAFLSWEVPSSGAVLICSCVIAEIFHLREPWNALSNYPGSYVAESQNADPNNPKLTHYHFSDLGDWALYNAGLAQKKPSAKIITDAGNLRQTRSLNRLERFARLQDEPNFRGKPEWSYNTAAKNADNVFTSINVALVVLGSLLWAYGHLIWKPSE